MQHLQIKCYEKYSRHRRDQGREKLISELLKNYTFLLVYCQNCFVYFRPLHAVSTDKTHKTKNVSHRRILQNGHFKYQNINKRSLWKHMNVKHVVLLWSAMNYITKGYTLCLATLNHWTITTTESAQGCYWDRSQGSLLVPRTQCTLDLPWRATLHEGKVFPLYAMKAYTWCRDILHHAILSTVFGPLIIISPFFSAPFSNVAFMDWQSIEKWMNIRTFLY